MISRMVMNIQNVAVGDRSLEVGKEVEATGSVDNILTSRIELSSALTASDEDQMYSKV